jgi:hypothetical protein
MRPLDEGMDCHGAARLAMTGWGLRLAMTGWGRASVFVSFRMCCQTSMNRCLPWRPRALPAGDLGLSHAALDGRA